MKFSAVLVLLVLIAGILCPSQITIAHADDDTYLVNLDVCGGHAQALSVDSNIPAIIAAVTGTSAPFESEFKFFPKTSSYRFLPINDFLKPPCA